MRKSKVQHAKDFLQDKEKNSIKTSQRTACRWFGISAAGLSTLLRKDQECRQNRGGQNKYMTASVEHLQIALASTVERTRKNVRGELMKICLCSMSTLQKC